MKKVLSMIGKVLKTILLVILVAVISVAAYSGVNSVFAAMAASDFSKLEDSLVSENVTLNYPVFDGTQVWENASVVIENGIISEQTVLGEGEVDSNYFLMPGLIDAHTHMSDTSYVGQMIYHGVTTTCDVAASDEVMAYSELLNIWSARSGAFAMTEDGEAFVEDMISRGAKYIKVVVDIDIRSLGLHQVMEPAVLREIVDTAHANGLKVAVHAVTLDGVQMSVDAGADMLIHVPIGAELPEELAQQIADQGMVVLPTLVMMKGFCDSPLYGYVPEDYQDAVNAVKLLHSLGVEILAATDANPGGILPGISYGPDLHREMELLVEAGLTPLEVLQGATSKTAEAFEIENVGVIAPGQPATMILVEGRPDQEITDSTRIVQIWVNGKPILEDISD